MACVAPPSLLHSPPPVPLQPRGIDNDDSGLEEKEVGGGKEEESGLSAIGRTGEEGPWITNDFFGGGRGKIKVWDCKTNFCQKIM